MITRVTFDRPIPGLVKRDDAHPTTFAHADGYTIVESDRWIFISHRDAFGARLIPQSRVIYAEVDGAVPVSLDDATRVSLEEKVRESKAKAKR